MNGSTPRLWIMLLRAGLACSGLVCSTLPAQSLPPAVWIHLTENQRPEVTPLERLESLDPTRSTGLLIWTQGRWESCRVLSPTDPSTQVLDALAAVSRVGERGRAEAAPAENVSLESTVQLDQLLGSTVFRGKTFITPAAGACHLESRPTIRRRAAEGNQAYPAMVLELRQGSRTLLQIPLGEKQARITWVEIPAMPAALQKGLPPGEYTLRARSSGDSTTFTVEPADVRQWVMETPEELAQLLGTKRHPLYLQVAASHLLAQLDENDRPRPYVADALDLLDEASEDVLTPHLRQLRRDLLDRLEGKASTEIRRVPDDATGIAPIDAARRLLRLGKWKTALVELDSPAAASTARGRALAALYRAVILTESGQTTDAAARALFLQAVENMKDNPADLFRARNNYANFLLGRSQDSLHNHAFLIASGVFCPVIRALTDWREALQQYEAAAALSADLAPADTAAVQVNLARLYNLLADVIRTLDPPVGGARRFAAGERAAAEMARQLVAAALAGNAAQTDSAIRAAGHEILAQLALRAENLPESGREIDQAIAAYQQVGALAGVEGCYRLWGILSLYEAAEAKEPGRSASLKRRALQRLMISQLLAEFLREQIPGDELGLCRSGFFARRAYVNQRIAELLIAQGKSAEALRYVEMAKARGLQDVLAAGAVGTARKPPQARDIAEILAAWPNDVAAVEYYLGTRETWLFLVSTSGKVGAHVLKDSEGRPLESRQLIARVEGLLADIDHQAEAMRQRLAAGQGFDSAWQNVLHEFYRQLLPAEVMLELRKAKTVLIVPHHVLHYFPMSALVTQLDESGRTPAEMVKPKFLLDEPFDLCYAPSLGAWDLLRQRSDRPIHQVTATGIVNFPNAQPLPGVVKDLDNLRTVFGDRTSTTLPNQEASETRVRTVLGNQGLLFVATHGRNLADQPLDSYLLFHADDKNDGYLTAREVFGSSVGADLVVMSACYSGLADRSPLPGDDLFGLQRAFLHAGARTIVAGVWDVYDGTGPELMRRFFQQLAAGQPVHAALARSQRELLGVLRASPRVEPWLHPYFWAVYTAVGDDRTHFAASKTGEQ